MPVVTIARQLGAEGEALAEIVGRHLGARVLDHQLLTLASERSGIAVSYLERLDERGRSMWRRPRDLVELVPLPPINPDLPDVIGDRYPPTGPVMARGDGLVSPVFWASEAYATLLARTIQAVAAGGDAVCVGRAGNEALAGIPGTFHVLVIAGEAERIRRVGRAEQMDAFDARDRVHESDANRRRYVRQFFGADWLDPARYDLVINTDREPIEGAAQAIITAARAAAMESESAGAAAAPAVAPVMPVGGIGILGAAHA